MTGKAKFKVISLFAFLVAILFLLYSNESVKVLVKNLPVIGNLYSYNKKVMKKIKVGDTEIRVEVAKSTEEKAKGLSGRERLGENEGMLFVFEKKSYPTFWMKDMNFAIDIIWIADGVVVGIEKDIQPPEKETPDAKLEMYRPPEPIDYVLEVNAGLAENNNIDVNGTVQIFND